MINYKLRKQCKSNEIKVVFTFIVEFIVIEITLVKLHKNTYRLDVEVVNRY